MNLWIFLTILAAFFLVLFYNKRGVAWGGMTLGVVFGLILAAYFALFGGTGFDWYLVGKAAVIGVLSGCGIEFLFSSLLLVCIDVLFCCRWTGILLVLVLT